MGFVTSTHFHQWMSINWQPLSSYLPLGNSHLHVVLVNGWHESTIWGKISGCCDLLTSILLIAFWRAYATSLHFFTAHASSNFFASASYVNLTLFCQVFIICHNPRFGVVNDGYGCHDPLSRGHRYQWQCEEFCNVSHLDASTLNLQFGCPPCVIYPHHQY